MCSAMMSYLAERASNSKNSFYGVGEMSLVGMKTIMRSSWMKVKVKVEER